MSDHQNKGGASPQRDASGRLLPGHTANPGGKPALPDWLKQKGEKFLRMQADVVETGKLTGTDGQSVEVDLDMRMKTLESLVMRIFGKPAQSLDVGGEALNDVLARLLAGRGNG
jgi:hypothetical protein